MDANLTYAVYVTAGKNTYNSNYEWGGCHITMAGFSPDHGSKKSISAIKQVSLNSLQSNKEWTPPKNISLEKWKGKWTIVINDSKTLDSVASQLKVLGFSKVKGTKESGTKFHITLPHVKSKEGAQTYANGLKKKKWYLTVVQSDSNTIKWTKHYPLGICK